MCAASRSPLGLGLTLCCALGGSACEAELETVPEGKLVRIGGEALGPEDVQEVRAQLGAYAQARFRGPEGQRSLIDALIDAEVLSQEAIAGGLGDDPRVHWAVVEEMATLQLNAELERRLPRREVAEDVAALRRHYDEHIDEFRTRERRSLQGVRFSGLPEAERALAKCKAGEAQLSDFGEVVSTPLTHRDDAHFPGFHAVLFDPSLAEGDWLPHPVITERMVVAGRVGQLEASVPLAFDDAEVQERLINEVREQRLAPIRAQLMQELAERYPVEDP